MVAMSKRKNYLFILTVFCLISGLAANGFAKASMTFSKAEDNPTALDSLTLTDVDVRKYSGDFEEWSNGFTYASPGSIWFRWKTAYQSVGSAKWTVFDTAHRIVAQGIAGGEPASAQTYQEFAIDFAAIVNNDTTRPLKYTVEVSTFRKPQSSNFGLLSPSGGSFSLPVANMFAPKLGASSAPVSVTFTTNDSETQFNAPNVMNDPLLLERMDVRTDLEHLTIYGKGYDEDPYLLVAAIYMDGTTITPTLSGTGSQLIFPTSTVQVKSKSKTHENVPGGDPGDVIPIPATTGQFENRITPVGFNFARSFGASAAQHTLLRENTFVAIVVVGLEEDAVPSTGVMNGARDQLVLRLTEELTSIVQGFSISLPIADGSSSFDVDEVIEQLGQKLRDEITGYASERGSDEFDDLLKFPAWPINIVFGAANQDDYIGQDVAVFSYQDIMLAGPNGLSFELLLDQNCACGKVWPSWAPRTEDIYYEVTGRIRYLP